MKNLVGEEGRGYKYMLEALNGARISHAARSVGIAEAAFEASLAIMPSKESSLDSLLVSSRLLLLSQGTCPAGKL